MMAMETSSPLAAMQPPSFAASWLQGRRDQSSLDSAFLRPPPSYRPGNFDFNKMSMQKPSSDYFSCKPVRGSSPTQSLAVDLSQNFHIDKSSPQVLTPRRSLFTGNLLDVDRKRHVITPPIPSSSPCLEHDVMEASPLPHKQPQVFLESTALCSPTPDLTPATEYPMVMPEIRRSESQPVNPTCFKPPPVDRKTSNPVRPSIRKGYSHSGQLNPSLKASHSSQPPFWFGPRQSTITKPSLETFMESPPSERKLPPSQSNPSMNDSPVSFIPAVQNGSPIANARRAPLPRARSGIGRRSQSMQCNEPYRPVRAEKRCCTTGSIRAASAVIEQPALKLPNFKSPEEIDGLPRITMDTLLDVIDGQNRADLGEVLVIDCRFEYEFRGGHIEGALNFNDKEEIANKLFEGDSVGNKTLVFHCEYSAHRAPLMAKFVRQRDRTINQDSYPFLSYPDVYILDGGYHNFFRNHPRRCFPQNYVEMDAKEHENACERGMAKVKRRNKLSRAQTYAFGQSSASAVPTMSSDFSRVQGSLNTIDAMDVDFNSPIEMKFPPSSTAPEYHLAMTLESPLGTTRLPARRMGSY